jgi:hypothetical protein
VRADLTHTDSNCLCVKTNSAGLIIYQPALDKIQPMGVTDESIDSRMLLGISPLVVQFIVLTVTRA